MSYLAPLVSFVLVGCTGLSARALSLHVVSDPPGAEVHASPADQPIAYKKGITPCNVQLDGAGVPFALLVRKAGYFDAYRYIGAASQAVSVRLHSRDDPANWARLPSLAPGASRLDRRGEGWWALLHRDRVARKIGGMRRFVDTFLTWAPDGSGALCRGVALGRQLAEEHLLEPGEEGAASDLWWVPVQGEPRLLWRWHVREAVYRYFVMSGGFAPDPRWCVHSAAEGDREHLRLSRLDTANSRPIAADGTASLYLPSFSPTGRLVACVRAPDSDEEDPPAEIQVMHFNGSARRTVARDADDDFRPVFSPDERSVAYVTHEGQVAVASIQGGDPEAMIDDPDWRPWAEPRWSPDGRRVAVTCGARTADTGLGMAGVPPWHHEPDPSRIVWARTAGEERGLIRACRLVEWHGPDALVALAKGYAPGPAATYDRLAAVGLSGELRAVLREPEALLYAPCTSPDGKRVAVLGWCGEKRCGVYLYDTGAETLTHLTHGLPAGRREIGWTSNAELWVAVGGEPGPTHGLLIDVNTGEAREAQRRPDLVGPDAEDQPYLCMDGDLFRGPNGGRIGPPSPFGLQRLTRLNREPLLAPTLPPGGDGE